MILLVEKLTFRLWTFTVLPRLWSERAGSQELFGPCYFIDSTRAGMLAAAVCGRLTGLRAERLDFRLIDVRDEEGLLLRLRIAYRDLAEVQQEALECDEFARFMQPDRIAPRLPTFLSKSLITISFAQGTMWRALLLVQITRWKARAAGHESGRLILERRPWFDVMQSYGERHGVDVEPSPPTMTRAVLIDRCLTPTRIAILRLMRDILFPLRYVPAQLAKGRPASRMYASTTFPWTRPERNREPRIGVEYFGHMHLDQPEYYSDLFFWQNSALSGNDMQLVCRVPLAALDGSKSDQLSAHGIGAIALNANATKTPDIPVFVHYPHLWRRQSNFSRPADLPRTPETKWLSRQVDSYWADRAYWRDLFAAENIKLFVTWLRFDAGHTVLADALEDLGGITAIYQRAFQPDASTEIAVDANVMFGYAPGDAEVERRSGSVIPYHVAVGYFGDHRAPLLRVSAEALRKKLMGNGAQYIMAFFDENSAGDERWHTGHSFMRVNYAFLLEKVLSEPWFGLVLKPKVSATLRQRLGPVRATLERAIETGRCHLYETDQRLHSSRTPVEAALSSDITVHGHLCASTAGLEAALAGVPTLLVDREGWSCSCLYQLGVGRVVFTDWDELWKSLIANRSRPGSIPGFGDWSTMIDEMDPFRDGRGAERMGTYLYWLLEGFKAGHDRDAILADAAERYSKQWGADKITSVNPRSHHDDARPPVRVGVTN
jgi:hypothetical protein